MTQDKKASAGVYQPAHAAVMITGGSGFIGRRVVKLLSEHGKPVVAVYHHRLPEALDHVFPVCSDMSSAELMAAPLRGVETVVHLAWEGGLAGPSESFAFNTSIPSRQSKNIETIVNLIQAMERAKTKRLVFVSAIGASRQTSVPFLREKYMAEHYVLNSKIPQKVILRSSVVWGDEEGDDRFLRSIMRVLKYPLYPVPHKEGGLAPIHVLDLAQLVSDACFHDISASAALLDITGAESYKLDELFRMITSKLVKKTRFPIGGVLGTSLLPLFERDGKNGPKTTKIQHFLALGNQVEDHMKLENPLSDMVPKKLTTFRESLESDAPKG